MLTHTHRAKPLSIEEVDLLNGGDELRHDVDVASHDVE